MIKKYLVFSVCVLLSTTCISYLALSKEGSNKDATIQKVEVIDNNVSMEESNSNKNNVGNIDNSDTQSKEEAKETMYTNLAKELLPYMMVTSNGYKAFISNYKTLFTEECIKDIKAAFKNASYEPYTYEMTDDDYKLRNKQGKYPIYKDDSKVIMHYGTKEAFKENMTRLTRHKVSHAKCIDKGDNYMRFYIICGDEQEYDVFLYFDNNLISSYVINSLT